LITPQSAVVRQCFDIFSGNIHRFRESYEAFYFNGISDLKTGEKLDKEIRKDEEKFESKCPKCGYSPFARRCVSCGHEKVALSLVTALPGEMVEITIGKRKVADSPEHLWSQLATYVRGHGNPDTARGRASHLYKDIMGHWPPHHFDVVSAPVVEVSSAVVGKIRSRQIAFTKGVQKYGARR
jgi:hypothetical protein